MDSTKWVQKAVDENQKIAIDKKDVLRLLRNKSCKTCKHYIDLTHLGRRHYCLVDNDETQLPTSRLNSFCDDWKRNEL